MFSLVKPSFTDQEVRDYERRRYRGLDQKLVHRRELQILEKIARLIDSAETPGSSPRPAFPRMALDAPCGYGRFSSFLREKGYRSVNADLSLAMVDRALHRQFFSTFPMGIVCDLVQGLPFRPGVFSLVLSMRLFHHLHTSTERKRVLAGFARVVRGWVIVSYYQSNPLHRWQRRLRRLIRKSRTRIRMLRRDEFEEEAREAGLEVVRVFPLFRGLHAQHIALLRKG